MKPYKQIFLPPVVYYAMCLWPWWARWCRPLREWYMRRHPERFATGEAIKRFLGNTQL